MFSLLKQSWVQSQLQTQSQLPTESYSLSNDVLITARDLLSALPPLSLAMDTKIPPLGSQTLSQVYLTIFELLKYLKYSLFEVTLNLNR